MRTLTFSLSAALITSVIAMTNSTISYAADAFQEVMTMTTDARPGEVYQFSASSNSQGDLSGFNYQGADHKITPFTLAQVKHGAVLLHDNDHNLDVVTLTADSGFSSHDGGTLKMSYLLNGITKSYRYFEMQVLRVGSQWLPYTGRDQGNAPFTSMFMRTNKVLGQTVGIKRIEVK